jgi:hypothetical protein
MVHEETRRRGEEVRSQKKTNHWNLCVFVSLWLKLLISANKHSLDSLAYVSGWDHLDRIRWFTRRRGGAEKRCDQKNKSLEPLCLCVSVVKTSEHCK